MHETLLLNSKLTCVREIDLHNMKYNRFLSVRDVKQSSKIGSLIYRFEFKFSFQVFAKYDLL